MDTADISISELEILSGQKAVESVRTAVSTVIEIEIFPLVTAKFRNGRNREDVRTDAVKPVATDKIRQALITALTLLEEAEQGSLPAIKGANSESAIPAEKERWGLFGIDKQKPKQSRRRKPDRD